MTQTKQIRKPWWESKSAALLKEFAKTGGGTYAAAKLHGLKYTRQHVRVRLPHELGECIVTLADPSSSSSGQAHVIGIKYSYRPRRKLEFDLCSAKRPAPGLLSGRLRPAALPDSALNKRFRARASHPGLLRPVLKQDGLAEALELHPGAHIKLRLKAHEASLSFSESVKHPDVPALVSSVQLMKLLIQGLYEQGVIYEKP
ncbi:hypothetical protein NYE69_06305 [Paenibacillus sp. FSL R5-0527]|uniref:hypothetical protein n=1 Tax=Paenibacillus sp. FSL R5-0527 TaxID=2975321 RepID=UPI00097A7421|nr:hypothetical protein [Paenibacillus macerans]OMG46387.1 hypothetical protein BK140_27440 [Paenibacillus macerans]